MKISDKQKELILKMREGGVMFVPHSYLIPKKEKIVIRNGTNYVTVNMVTFKAIKSRGLIYQYKFELYEQSIYKLTELGKTIEL